MPRCAPECPILRIERAEDSLMASPAAAAPAALWGSPLGPHSLENIGPGPLHIISVELKALQLHSALTASAG